jgi:valyl-tRNA synthetase
MPFVTEELWQHLSDRNGTSIMRAPFPIADPRLINPKIEQELDFVMRVIEAVRNIRGELNVAPSRVIDVVIALHGEVATQYENEPEYLRVMLTYMERLAKAKTQPIWVKPGESPKPPKQSASAVVSGQQIYVPLEGLIDLAVERARLQKEIDRITRLLEATRRKLENESFVSKAPADVVETERAKLRGFGDTVEKLQRSLEALIPST